MQVDPGLLSMLLLQELVGLHAALAGLLRLRPGEPHLVAGRGGVGPQPQAWGVPRLLPQHPPGGQRTSHLGHFPLPPNSGWAEGRLSLQVAQQGGSKAWTLFLYVSPQSPCSLQTLPPLAASRKLSYKAGPAASQAALSLRARAHRDLLHIFFCLVL